MKVDCNGEVHEVVIGPKGHAHFAHHTADELDAMETAAALAGVTPTGCALFRRCIRHQCGLCLSCAQRVDQRGTDCFSGNGQAYTVHLERRARAARAQVHARWYATLDARIAGRAAGILTCIAPTAEWSRGLLPSEPEDVELACAELGTSAVSLVHAATRVGRTVELHGSGIDVTVLKVYSYPSGKRPGLARVWVPGRGGKRYYAADVTLRQDEDGVWVARRRPGQAPPPRQTAADRAAQLAEDVRSIEQRVAGACAAARPGDVEWLDRDTVAVGNGFESDRRTARRLSWTSLARVARAGQAGRVVADNGGTVANAYKYPAVMEVGVAVCVEGTHVVVFRGEADAHGSGCDMKSASATIGDWARPAFDDRALGVKHRAARDGIRKLAATYWALASRARGNR